MTTLQAALPRTTQVAFTNAALFNGLYQMAFITSDLDAAQERLAARFGIRQFRVRHDPGRASTAHAFAGDMMVEIIHPDPEGSPIFLDDLPAGGGLRLHHLGYLVPNVEKWQEIETLVAQQKWNVPIHGAVMEGHLRFLFADMRAELGHYHEYVCLTGPAQRIYDDVPAN